MKAETEIASEVEQQLREDLDAEIRTEIAREQDEALEREVLHRLAPRLRERLPGAIAQATEREKAKAAKAKRS